SGPVLIAYDATFRRLWEVNVGGPRLVALTAADIDRDGRDEVLAGYEAQTLRVVAVDGTGGIAWRYNPSDWPGAATVSSLFAADLDGDGAPEIVGGAERQACFALRADGSPMWRGSGDRRRREIALAEPVRYAKQIPGTQVLLMGRRNFTVRAGSGPRIFSASSGLTLTDSASGTTQPNVIYLASSGFRDSAYYRLTFTHTGENALESYARPNPIGEGLDELYARVVAISPLPMPTGARAGRKFHVLLYRNNREQVRVVWPKLKARNTPNVEYEILTYAKELPVELHRFPMKSVPEILDYVRFFESEAIPFYLFVDHGCRPWISLETARQILDAAPNALRGFYCAEDNYDYPGDLFWDWLKWAGALLDLCHDRGKKVVFKEMYDCWSLLAADKRVYDVLFKYPDTVVPMFATNNAHAAEIQVGGMLGLWRAGACEDWGMSSQHWNWNWEDSSQRIDYADLCPPDVIFRMDLAAASLGCTYFHVEGGQKWLDNAGDLQPEAKRHRELLYQMIERNLLLPVSPSQLAGLSPVAIARTTDPGRAPGARIGLPRGRIGTPFRDGFLGVRGAIQTTPSEYFPAYAYGIQRFFDGLFPTTPYGYVQLVPAFLGDRQRVAEAFVETDTTDVIVAGRRMTARQARRTVLSMLKRAAAKLPFRCDGAFLSVQRWGDEYRLVVIDPGYLTPVGARAEIRTNLVRAPVIVSDLITNERVHVGDDSFAVAVPPGGLRLLSVKVR
ncbi:MAG: FG-GAP-like repeat-containing protein, partial [Armatimonadota bacterium]